MTGRPVLGLACAIAAWLLVIASMALVEGLTR